MSADSPWKTPDEDILSSSGSLFSECAPLKQDYENITENNIMTIRAYHYKFSHISVKNNIKQVNVFSQTFVIDADIDINYILIVRSRVIFLDRQEATLIRFSEKTSRIRTSVEEWQQLIKQGPNPDNLFQRMSYVCAQVLLNTKDNSKIYPGYSILKSIANAPVLNEEQKAMKRSATALLTRLSGLDLTKAHYVPFYSKDHLIKQLDTYFTEISIYKEDYDRLYDANTLAEKRIIAIEMNEIHKDTIIAEAMVAVENLEQSYQTDIQTQFAMEIRYNEARIQFENSRAEAEKEAEKKKRRSFLKFAIGMARVMMGDARGVKKMASTTANFVEYQQTMTKLADTVAVMDSMLAKTSKLKSADMSNIYDNEDQVMLDIKTIVAMRINIVEWKALQAAADIHMDDINLKSGPQFHADLAEYCTWGEALNEIMASTAETLRALLEARAILDLRLEQERRTTELLEKSLKTLEQQQMLLRVMEEQVLDVTVDLNEILIQFCLAYFYETLQPCKDNLRPSYQESMKELLLKINIAKRDGLYIADVTSSVSRSLILKDANDNVPRPDAFIVTNTYEADDENTTLICEDQAVCPVTYFNNHKTLVISLNTNHPEFSDLHKYRVDEIFLTLLGLPIPNANEHMKVYLSTSGLFHDQHEMVYNFVTRPIQLAFEQELDSTGMICFL